MIEFPKMPEESGPSLWRVFEEILLNYPKLRPLVIELAKVDMLQHGGNVAVLYINLVNKLYSSGLISLKTHSFIADLNLGTALHDIGKCGVSPIYLALPKYGLNPPFRILNSNKDFENLPKPYRQLHPLVGGHLIRLLGKKNYLPEQVANLNAQIDFQHHEYPIIPPHEQIAGYGRSVTNGLVNSNIDQRKAAHLPLTDIKLPELAAYLTKISDVAIAMKEERSYKKELSVAVINDELQKIIFLSIIEYFLPLFQLDEITQLNLEGRTLDKRVVLEEIKQFIIEIIIKHLKNNGDEINIPFEHTELANKLGSVPVFIQTVQDEVKELPLLRSLVKETWIGHRQQISSQFANYLVS